MSRDIWRERFLIILQASQSARLKPPTICCPCDALVIGSDEPLRGQPDVSSLHSLCFHAQRCGRARGQLGEGRDAHHARFRDLPTHVRCAAAGRAWICCCACQPRPPPPDVLRFPQHAGRPCAGLLRARLVRQSEYASKGSTIITTWCSCIATYG